MKLEIGGGTRNRGDDWVNLDICQEATIRHDLNVTPWPFDDESVDEIYSSHCIEHVQSVIGFVCECARIGKIGAHVEIRCPDAMSEMAMVHGHVGVVAINVIRHMDTVFPDMFWTGKRRLRLIEMKSGPDDYWFPKARESHLFRGWSDDDILTWIPRTCHERHYHFEVTANDQRH